MVKYHPRLKLVHGFQARQHPLYQTWSAMRNRCYDPKNKQYKDYGGRGITVCEEWKNAFEPFALDMGLQPSSEHSLDRIDNEKGYSKDNCKWSTRLEQNSNRRTFDNNTTGETGIVLNENGSFNARYDENKQRYNLGNFETIEKALEYRNKFIALLNVNKKQALLMTQRRARLDSATGIKGISKNEEGYIVRVTLLDGTRKYLGFSKTLEGAVIKLNSFEGPIK